LIAELRDDAGFGGFLGDDTALVERGSHGLLQIDVFLRPQSDDRRRRVHMVRRADRHGVELVGVIGQ
jgi:hypothetical protein